VRKPNGQLFERTCATSGTGGVTNVSRSDALSEGPVTLGGLRSLTPQSSKPVEQGGRFGSIESIVIVAAGHDATLTVPASERTTVGLIYDGAKFRADGAYDVSGLDWSTRFVACADKRFNGGVSQFDGGYVVTRQQCVLMKLKIDGASSRDFRFPAGAPCRAGKAAST
jgi:hypothetical protein